MDSKPAQPSKLLPGDLVAVIHHVRLNESGWWQRAVEKMAVYAIWLSGGSHAPETLHDVLHRGMGLSPSSEDLSAALKRLEHAGDLFVGSDGAVHLSETARIRVTDETKQLEGRERHVRAKFTSLVKKCQWGGVAPPSWDSFHKGALVPLVRSMGARVYTLLNGTNGDVSETGTVAAYLNGFSAEARELARGCIVSFFDPTDDVLRQYLLDHMTASFCIEANRLSSTTIAKLAEQSHGRHRFTLFLDTNFIYSLLDLHESDFNQTVTRLRDVITNLPPTISVQLCILPVTLDELKRNLRANFHQARAIQTSASLIAVAMENVSGVLLRYFRQVGSKATLDAAERYFSPLLNDTMTILRSRGVELFNENTDSLRSSQAVIDDVNSRLAFENKPGRQRPKTYDQIEHDVVLWHMAQLKRPARVESPLEAQYFVVTLDSSLLGFDHFKGSQRSHVVPICLNPTALLQLLQFWLPRSQAMEEALVDSFRLPFLRQEFDRGAERITLDILAALSKFENTEDLPIDTVRDLVVNNALRSKIAVAADDAQEASLVKEALIEHNQKLTSKLVEVRRTAEEKTGRLTELERQLQETAEKAKASEEALEAIRVRDASQAAHQSLLRQRWHYALVRAAAPLSGALLLAGGVWFVQWFFFSDPSLRGPVIVLALLVICSSCYAIWSGHKSEAVRSWWPYRVLKWVLISVVGLIVVETMVNVATGAGSSYLSSLIKDRFGIDLYSHSNP